MNLYQAERAAAFRAVLERVETEARFAANVTECTTASTLALALSAVCGIVGEALARDTAGRFDVCARAYSEFARCDLSRGHDGPCSGALPKSAPALVVPADMVSR